MRFTLGKEMNPLVSIVVYGLVLIAAVAWMLLRTSLFVSERWDIITLHPDAIAITIWLHRVLLLLVSAAGLFIAAPVALFGIGMGSSFGGSDREFFPILVGLLGFAFYMLVALILNFTGFPLRVHQRWFAPVHLVLLPSLLLLVKPLVFLAFLGVISAFFGFWILNLRDRLLYGQQHAEQDVTPNA